MRTVIFVSIASILLFFASLTTSIDANAQATGSLQVNLEPLAARVAGAGWMLRDTYMIAWRTSGNLESGIPVGEYTLTFKQLEGWYQPQDQTIIITENQTVIRNFDYTIYEPQPDDKTGNLKVEILPLAARDAGARWRLAKPAAPVPTPVWPWRNSGDTEIRIPIGEYLIEFEDVDGWLRPENKVVEILENQTEEESGVYRQPYEDGGAIQTVIEPPGARAAGARWRITGTTDWLESGTTVSALNPLIKHKVEFNRISGWNSPPSIDDIDVIKKETVRFTSIYTQDVLGALQVLIEPTQAATDGAQWRRAGTTTWFDSGQTEELIPAGGYEIEFKAVSGWNRPANAAIIIESGKTLFRTGTYTYSGIDVGSLQIRIEPEAARIAGARWRRVGQTTWRESESVELAVPVGIHELEFGDVVGWEKPEGQLVTVSKNELRSGTYAYYQLKGSLTVTITPPAVRDAGARWRLTSAIAVGECVAPCEWQRSGDTLPEIPYGDYLLEFLDVDHWLRPPNQEVSINASQNTADGTYRQPFQDGGAVQVLIEPAGARDDGAKWRIAGVSDWMESGAIVNWLDPAFRYTIEFLRISDWNLPPDVTDVAVRAGQTTRESITYVQRPQGALQVLLEPAAARSAGAQWRRAGTTTWLDSGVTEQGVPVGDHVIEFKAVSSWRTPDPQSIELLPGRTASGTGVYSRTTLGALHVLIEPEAARTAGAQWRLAGTDGWRESGFTEEGLPNGDYLVEFKPISNWERPNSENPISVNVTSPLTSAVTGTYASARRGAIKVSLEPQSARTAGAQWRRAGTTAWFDSGQEENQVPEGSHVIEFKEVSGWTSPLPSEVAVTHLQTSQFSASYAQARNSAIQVTLHPEAARAAGARWRWVGGSEWVESGESKTVPIGPYDIEANEINAWKKPENISIVVNNGSVSYVDLTYTPAAPGAIRIIIEPREARDLGAKWRMVGMNEWQESGSTIHNIPSGPHQFEFSNIPGWMQPRVVDIVVPSEEILAQTYLYRKNFLPGILMLLLD